MDNRRHLLIPIICLRKYSHKRTRACIGTYMRLNGARGESRRNSRSKLHPAISLIFYDIIFKERNIPYSSVFQSFPLAVSFRRAAVPRGIFFVPTTNSSSWIETRSLLLRDLSECPSGLGRSCRLARKELHQLLSPQENGSSVKLVHCCGACESQSCLKATERVFHVELGEGGMRKEKVRRSFGWSRESRDTICVDLVPVHCGKLVPTLKLSTEGGDKSGGVSSRRSSSSFRKKGAAPTTRDELKPPQL